MVKLKNGFCLSVMIAAACCAVLVACGDDGKNRVADPTMFKVVYSGGVGGDSGISEMSYKAGTEITVAQNTAEYADHTFSGWKTGADIYKPGDTYTVPESDTLFTAVWKEITYSYPAFGKESYAYDRWGANDLEITLDLDGADLCYVEIDGKTLYSVDWRYDTEKGCLVIAESYVLSLADGEYTVKAITDSAEAGEVSCKLSVDNSVKTSFDEVREKNFRYGYDCGVGFELKKGLAEVTEVLCGDVVLDKSYYEFADDTLTVKSEWIGHFCDRLNFTVKLNNYDSYNFSIKPTNIIFASDYDVNTIHDLTASNTGGNSLYQYFDNVSITDSPSAMNSGKALKITPNTTQNPLDCNGYMTLCTQEYTSKTSWRNGTFEPGKNYYISFDYMTENTSTGILTYKDPHSDWSRTLLMGEENDGTVHRFFATVAGDELKHGLYIYAFFPGGGALYIDNFFVAEFDGLPEISADSEYLGSGDLAFTLNTSGLRCDFMLDGQPVDPSNITYDVDSGSGYVSAAALSELAYGTHTIGVHTVFGTAERSFDVIDGRVAEIADTRVTYASETDTEVKIRGSFSEGLLLTSLVQKPKTYNKKSEDAVYDGWNFSASDTQKNYKDHVRLTTGDENNGYITLSKEFLDLFWGETEFEASFDNGKRVSFTLLSDVLLYTNYDDTTVFGYKGDNAVCGSPLNSGLDNNSVAGIENIGDERNNAFVIRRTDDAQEPSAFTIKFRDHVWDWFYTKAEQNDWLRITFDYQISGLDQDSVYFYIMGAKNEDVNRVFLGDYDEIVELGWIEVRYFLVADGKPHTFDSGWFLYPDDGIDCRMVRITLPRFDQADGKYILFDNYRVVTRQTVQGNFLSESYGYERGQDTAFELDLPQGVTVSKVTADGAEIGFTSGVNKITLDGSDLDKLDKGAHVLYVYNNCGRFISSLNVTMGGQATLIEKSKNVVYGKGGVKLAGEFSSGITVTSLKRKAFDYWDNTNPDGGCAVKSDGTLKTSYLTVATDGLIVSEALVNSVYGEISYTAEFSNGAVETFTLKSNVIRYSDYDENYVHQENGKNVESFQDTDMIAIEKDGDGNTRLVYRPQNASQGHSVSAMNGGDQWNAVFTFANERYIPNEWYHYLFPENSTVFVFFDYEIVDPDDKANYQFSWWDTSDVFHPTKLTGEGHFYLEISADEMKRFFINCPVASPGNVVDTYMTVDNFGFGIKTV